MGRSTTACADKIISICEELKALLKGSAFSDYDIRLIGKLQKLSLEMNEEDDVVKRYRERREKRIDANTRLPFGLCQREGIEIGDNWTPQDAWDALAKKGITPDKAYGEAKGEKSEGSVPQRSVDEWKKMGKVIDRHDRMERSKERATKEMEKADKEYKRLDKWIGTIGAQIKSKEMLMESLLNKWGNEENMSPTDKHEYHMTKLEKKWKEEDLKRYIETRGIQEKKREESRAKLEKLMSQSDEGYEEAIKAWETEHPYNDSVREYRIAEEESRVDKRKLLKVKDEIKDAEEDIKRTRVQIEEYERRGTPTFFLDEWIKGQEENLEKLKKMEGELEDRLEPYIKKMDGILSDKDEDMWGRAYNMAVEKNVVKNGPYDKLKRYADELEAQRIKYINPRKRLVEMDEDKIIEMLSGGDKTQGSCASLACAYIANKMGYDVLDFRGGASTDYFGNACRKLMDRLGGESIKSKNDFEVAESYLNKIEEGKEYWMAVGSHAAIVRKKDGKEQYLEMQSYGFSGWCDFKEDTLKRRFACRSARVVDKESSFIDISKVYGNEEFISLMGYINTNEDRQKKGVEGSVK